MDKKYSKEQVLAQVLKKTLELRKAEDSKKINTAHEVEDGVDPVVSPKAKKKGMNPDGSEMAEGNESAENDEYQDRELLDEHNESKHNEAPEEDSAFDSASPEEKEKKKKEEESKKQAPPMAKSEVKGVHTAAKIGHNFKGGTSEAGHQVASSKGPAAKKYPQMGEKNISNAKAAHKKVMSDMKEIKPNLPKAEKEMDGSDNDVETTDINPSKKLKSFLEKKMAKREANQ